MLRGYIGTFIGLAGLSCGLTWVFLGMRSVMEIGGTCASGGPYEIAQPCPEGVGLLMVGGIFGGLIFLGVFLGFSGRLGGSYGTIAGLAWPALFLSLGWNFFEYGIAPPGPDDGLVWGWLFCGVLFALMGGLPLLAFVRPSSLRSMFWPADPRPDAFGRSASHVTVGAPLGAKLGFGGGGGGGRPERAGNAGAPTSRAGAATATRPAAPPRAAPPAAPAAAPGGASVVTQLERLADLRDRGALDADEYERAKKAVLGG